MKFIFDFFPVLVFFIAFKIVGDSEAGFYLATMALIIASMVQIAGYWLIYRRFEKMHLITLVAVLVLGGATLYLQDERFLKWKPTLVLWVFAVILLASQYIGKKNIFQRMVQYSDARITAPVFVWFRLNFSLALFFILAGIANLYVAFNFSRSVWVDFKVFGLTGLNLVFMAGLMVYMLRHASIPDDLTASADKNKEGK